MSDEWNGVQTGLAWTLAFVMLILCIMSCVGDSFQKSGDPKKKKAGGWMWTCAWVCCFPVFMLFIWLIDHFKTSTTASSLGSAPGKT